MICVYCKTHPLYPLHIQVLTACFFLSWVKMDNESVLSGHTGHSEPPTSRLSKSNLNNLNNKVTKSNTNLNDKVTKSITNLNDKVILIRPPSSSLLVHLILNKTNKKSNPFAGIQPSSPSSNAEQPLPKEQPKVQYFAKREK